MKLHMGLSQFNCFEGAIDFVDSTSSLDYINHYDRSTSSTELWGQIHPLYSREILLHPEPLPLLSG